MNQDSKSKAVGLLWLCLTALIAIIFALGLPALGKFIPWSIEKRIGSALQVQPGLLICHGARFPESVAALQKLEQRIYPVYPDDHLFDLNVDVIHGDIINAFATLGGHIYVYDGLLKRAESPDELAGVLAHELEHVSRRHIIQGLIVRLLTIESLRLIFASSPGTDPGLFNFLLNMKFSREQEEEADEGGLKRLREVKIDSSGFQHFFERIQNLSQMPSLLSDHPSNENRSALALKYKAKETTPVMSQADWQNLKRICN